MTLLRNSTMSAIDQVPIPVRRSPRRLGAYQAPSLRPAGEIVRAAVVERLFLDTMAARGVAGTAMAGALDQIGAAIPDGVMVWLCDIASARAKKKFQNASGQRKLSSAGISLFKFA